MSEVITNPVEALVAVGKENSELHEEVTRLYAEIDRYRAALTAISAYPYAHAAFTAKQALAHKGWKT